MLELTTGNILDSDATCLVNTVNCEGYMGKGLAYQFKNKYPETNKSYIQACKNGTLHPGTLHFFHEDGKLIINFPTKDKWREKSKIEYIEQGMKALTELITSKHIDSIAIPPLGSGNGGLRWEEVREVILKSVSPLIKQTDVTIYEPSLNYKAEIKQIPKLTLSHLLLMKMKQRIDRFSKFRLQKTAFFMNILSHQDYFKFNAHHFGPYSHSIDILSRDIREFQTYHKFNTDKALAYIEQTLTSKKIEDEIEKFDKFIDEATNLINLEPSNERIELWSTICYVLFQNNGIEEKNIITTIHEWSDQKKEKFSDKKILHGIQELVKLNVIHTDIFNKYSI